MASPVAVGGHGLGFCVLVIGFVWREWHFITTTGTIIIHDPQFKFRKPLLCKRSLLYYQHNIILFPCYYFITSQLCFIMIPVPKFPIACNNEQHVGDFVFFGF